MKKFLKNLGIFHYFSYGDRKSSIVERVNRTLQNILYPLMHHHKTNRWVDLLEDMVNIYNSRKHRTIQMRPKDAEKNENQRTLQRIYRERYNLISTQKPRFKKGQLVRLRIKSKGGIPRREYLQSFTDEKYIIDEVSTIKPFPMYKVKKLNGEKVTGGSFYAWELSETV